MGKIALDLGFVQIYWYSICILLGILSAAIIVYLEMRKQKMDKEFFTNLMFYIVIFGIIGARLYYVLFNLNYYSKYPVEILEIWNGGLAIHGGIFFGALIAFIYSKKYKYNPIKVFDIIVVGLLIGQAIGRWGNFFNQEAYGPITTLAKLKSLGISDFIINGMYIYGNYYQPTFLYESIWCVFGFVVLLLVRKLPLLKVGQLTGLYMIWYSTERFIIEGLRQDSLMLGSFKVAQIVSVLFIVIGIYFLVIRPKKSTRFGNLYKETIEDAREEKL